MMNIIKEYAEERIKELEKDLKFQIENQTKKEINLQDIIEDTAFSLTVWQTVLERINLELYLKQNKKKAEELKKAQEIRQE